MFELIVYEEGLLPFFRCNFDRCALISGRDWKRRVPGPERPLESQIRRESARPLLADTTLPASRRKAAARRVEGFLRAAAGTRSDFDLLRDLQGIVDLDTEVPDCRFQPMPEKSSHDSPEQSPSKSHQGGCDVVTLLRATPFAALPHRTSGIRLFSQELSEPKRAPQSR